MNVLGAILFFVTVCVFFMTHWNVVIDGKKNKNDFSRKIGKLQLVMVDDEAKTMKCSIVKMIFNTQLLCCLFEKIWFLCSHLFKTVKSIVPHLSSKIKPHVHSIHNVSKGFNWPNAQPGISSQANFTPLTISFVCVFERKKNKNKGKIFLL